ncbi:cyclin-dependent kinase 12-like [Acanthochromis polyacanthus]|uniref:cyclin-dependent kinase 12-like n=1 Tax=Acanthochromis polyacanthus TaxID=80966 RepID=UPI000B8F442D|nr:cyclin-dependent kinase 12-like [Acanthochromis polyacanthus]XP_051801167.1 cyclin-dependent kinase 12-like [Acanthochromis polyacanthus]XP_051801168.1 cyclin-dependent kinase 12-like [Acanthochromis polyacanthus]
MYSNRSEHSHRRQYSDRSLRQWDEERREPHRDSYHKYGGDGHSSTERTCRSREYSDSPKRLYSKDSLSRDRSRKSPVRRHMSSPTWDPSEKKARRFAEDDEGDYRYRGEPQENSYWQSDSSSRAHVSKNFKDAPLQEEDFKFRKTPQDSRQRHRHEEFTYKQRHDDLTYRRSSGCYKDRDGHERSRDRSQERTRSQDRSTKNYVKPREKTDSPSTSSHHEDYHQNKTRFFLNESSKQSFESDVSTHNSTVPEQKSTKGFQRFLDVLNKGVNVDVLTKIVTQTSAEVKDRTLSPSSFMNSADRPWRQQGKHQSNWSESEGSHRRTVSPQHHHRSLSPQRRPPSDDKPQRRSDGRQNYFKSRSRSPPVVEKMTLTPEDEHKHRQMQDVLQAIGMDLGFEELGQMSHRIQERLYGKKESDKFRIVSKESNTRQVYSPKCQSRSSSSSRSDFSSLPREYHSKKDSYSAQRDKAEVHQAVDYGQAMSSLQDSEKCEVNTQESSPALQPFSATSTYPVSEPPVAPVMPAYSPVSCAPMPYPPLSPALSPALPPLLPHAAPGVFMPRLNPFIPYPRIHPLNIFPGVLAQTRHLYPQHINPPQPPFYNFPDRHAVQPLNTPQKSKTLSRPRCLQVIETKQPG